MNWILGASKKTSMQGIVAAIILMVLSFAGLTGTPVPKIDPITNTVMLDADGNVEFTDPSPLNPSIVVIALSLLGIGRTARDGDASSEDHKIK